MTMKEGDYVNSLIKVANDMVDVTEAKASPEEVLAALQEIIAQLETIANAIPAQEDPQAQAPADPALQQEVAQLREKVAKRDRDDIAVKYASLFEDSLRVSKTEEVLKSDKDNAYWLAKIDAINEFTQSTEQSHVKTAKSFSFQKMAKRDGELYIL